MGRHGPSSEGDEKDTLPGSLASAVLEALNQPETVEENEKRKISSMREFKESLQQHKLARSTLTRNSSNELLRSRLRLRIKNIEKGFQTSIESFPYFASPSMSALMETAYEKGILILNGKPDDAVIASNFGVALTRRTLQCLRSGQWLNDEIINYYMRLLQENNDRKVLEYKMKSKAGNYGKFEDTAVDDDSPVLISSDHSKSTKESKQPLRCCFFSSFFFNLLSAEDRPGSDCYNYEAVKRWTKRLDVDIFELDMLIFPVHVGKVHWALGVVDVAHKAFRFFDSLGHSGQFFARIMRRYLVDEYRDKKGNELEDISKWRYVSVSRTEVPQQRSSCDCGVFVCTFAKLLGSGLPFEFNQDYIGLLRVLMVLEIVSGQIDPDELLKFYSNYSVLSA